MIGRQSQDDEHLKDPELLKLAWTMLEQEWPVLVKMCRIAVYKSRGRDWWEEAMSEVALRLPQIMWTFDPTSGRTLRSHVIGSCRWYLFKLFVGAKRKEMRRRDELEQRALANGNNHSKSSMEELFDLAEVQYVLDNVHPFHKSILQLYYMSGLTYEEIGGVLGMSKSPARIRVMKALQAAQAVAATMKQ